MNTKRKKILVSLMIVLLIAIASLTYYSVQVNELISLGYTKQEAKAKVNLTSVFGIADREENALNGSISNNKDELLALGLKQEEVEKLDDQEKTLISKAAVLEKKKTERIEIVNTRLAIIEKQAATYKIKYNYKNPEANPYEKYVYLRGHLISNYNKLIKKYELYLKRYGFTDDELKKMKAKPPYQAMKEFKKLYDQLQYDAKKNQVFQSKTLHDDAMQMFKETNDYRKSLGLKPYKYNYNKQACVFKEATAYANNKNPHNWLCPCANENASLASVNSDYVAIAMKFFKSDPPHEAVLSGNYDSVAIAFVEKGGMVYMIMDVFYD